MEGRHLMDWLYFADDLVVHDIKEKPAKKSE